MNFEITLLQAAVFVPLICAVIVLCMRGDSNRFLVDALTFAGFTFPLLAALWLWYVFSPDAVTAGGFAFINGDPSAPGYDLGLGTLLGIRLAFGLNGISMPLLALAGIVGMAAGWQSLRSQLGNRRNLFLGLILMMHGGLMGVFASIDVFFFYFFHELALIPTFILIGIWGGPGKRTVTLEVAIYLTLGAMFSLLGLIAIYGNVEAPGVPFNFIALREYFATTGLETVLQQNIAGFLLLGFGILVSLFPFHSWAPRAYATAPTPNAMLHAGVLKKFGLYGIIQVAAPLMPDGLGYWSDTLVWLALGNIVLLGFVTCAQRDLKQMVAYSSVMHMGYVFLGIAAMNHTGAGGAVMLMFAHGLSVALMLLLAQYIHDRAGTFEMSAIGGLGPKAPLLAGCFVAATFAGAGLPGFANFWGEFAVFLSLGEHHLWAVAPAALGIVLSAIYGLRATANIFFGQPKDTFKSRFESNAIADMSLSERIPAALLIAALLFVGFWPKSISNGIDTEIAKLPAPAQPTELTSNDGQ